MRHALFNLVHENNDMMDEQAVEDRLYVVIALKVEYTQFSCD